MVRDPLFSEKIQEISGGGKSGAHIYITPDRKYTIKLMEAKDISLLSPKLMVEYYKRVMS